MLDCTEIHKNVSKSEFFRGRCPKTWSSGAKWIQNEAATGQNDAEKESEGAKRRPEKTKRKQ